MRLPQPLRHSSVLATVALVVLGAPLLALAQEEGPSKDKPKKKKGEIEPYAEVITEDAVTKKGLFTVHRIDDEVYFEIPREQLDTDMLWVTQIAGTQAGSSYAGMPGGSRVVRWELRDKKVLLRDVRFEIRANEGDSIHRAVEATSLAPILHTLPVKAWGVDQAPVVDATSLYTSDLPEFSVKRQMNASSADEKRSFIDEVKTFPTNVEAKVLLTYKLKKDDDAPPWAQRGGESLTVRLHHSMVRLPDDPMRPRREDERVGFFTLEFEDYTDDSNHAVENVSYIKRWRLEKKDPSAALSDPVKPIVFYVSREVPEKWRPFVHQGIESWQVAFEQAGFSNAVLAKDAPSEREDPDWDAEDARYSSIRWLPSDVENAFGPHVADPRTGEILEADIRMYHNVLKLVRDWYFVQAAPMDERAQNLPMPDDLVGELLAYVVAHEVGHSLGFPHNMKASSSYSVEQLRDAEFTAEFGNEASIMDYGRFNYVAQPGDGARLIPIIGPYDKFAVEWGYSQFTDAKTKAAEKERLDSIVARQLDNPHLLFGNPNPREDPSQQTEDLSSDAIAATALGLANIDRVASFLVEATCEKNEDYALLDNMYGELLGQRDRELGHVANLVGGFVAKNFWYGDADQRYHPVAADRQRSAVAFLGEHAFQTPQALVATDITRRLEASGTTERILRGQKRLLRTLLSEQRIDRMAEQTTWDAAGAYHPIDFVADLTDAIWSELGERSTTIDLYRRNLQRAHVELLTSKIDEEIPSSDLPSLARGELGRIHEAIGAALSTTQDRTTLLHLEDLSARIEQLLDPRAKETLLQAVEAAAGR